MKPTVEIQPSRASQSTILWRCFGYLRPHWKMVAGVYLTMVLIDLIAMVNPQVLRWAIDQGIGAGNDSLLTLAVVGLLALVLAAIAAFTLMGNSDSNSAPTDQTQQSAPQKPEKPPPFNQ